jgi:glycosyltransferase involved in cell wall biosynthesis
MPRQIHQILPTLAYGDAIGNEVLEIRRLFRNWGYVSNIFAEHWDPRLAKECRHFEEYRRLSNVDNLLIHHYSIGGAVNRFVMDLPDHLVLYYHNITPAHFFYRVNDEMARLMDEARRDLHLFVNRAPAIAASCFNQQELEAMGFRVLGVIPPILSFDPLDAGLQAAGALTLQQRFRKDGTVDWIHVGRLAPNKCIHDIIKAFYYFHHWITPNSRLLLVGTGDGAESYLAYLYRLVTQLDLDGSVVFTGHVDNLGILYQMADLYVSMSEHEGFCIPLLEAMHFEIPVLAFASTAIPETLDRAGVLFHQKDYAMIAEMAHEMISNRDLRQRLVQVQRERLAAFDPEQMRAQFLSCVQGLL